MASRPAQGNNSNKLRKPAGPAYSNQPGPGRVSTGSVSKPSPLPRPRYKNQPAPTKVSLL